MKPQHTQTALVAVSVLLCLSAAAARSAVTLRGAHLHQGGEAVALDALREDRRADLAETVSGLVTGMMLGQGPTVQSISMHIMKRLNFEDALDQLKGRLPHTVSALLTKVPSGSASATNGPTLNAASVDKAIMILNGMVEKAWLELSQTTVAAKVFEDRNRGSVGQVVTDLSRLGSAIADLQRQEAEGNGGIATMDDEIAVVDALLRDETSAYESKLAQDHAEIAIRRNDLAVLQFILELVKCKSIPTSATLAQLGPQVGRVGNVSRPVSVRVCSEASGRLGLAMDDPAAEASLEKMMTPATRRALHDALSAVRAGPARRELLQWSADDGGLEYDFGEEDGTINDAEQPVGVEALAARFRAQLERERKSARGSLVATTRALSRNAQPAVAASDEWKKCTNGAEDCGLLYDTMALQWGTQKDLVDELQKEIDDDTAAFNHLKDNLHLQKQTDISAKNEYMQLLSEATAQRNGDNNDQAEKELMKTQLEADYKKQMKNFKASIETILYTNICAVKKVRNELMEKAKVSTDDVVDCDVSDWLPGECSVRCDDTCPNAADPNACGGELMLTREIIQAAKSKGVQCPVLSMQRKCNQVKCPVNCLMSQWSAFSKCSKDCEGGVQAKTRSILTKPRNGGESCDTTQETRPCNTGSCDRDCTLDDWASWTTCTMACGGGLQDRSRKVLVPLRAGGQCPREESSGRREMQNCNEHECRGDEKCIATQDLIIAIDGSGGFREKGFAALRAFAAHLISKYSAKYFGQAAMRIGLLLFGNGHVEQDGTISPAIEVLRLTDNLNEVANKIKTLQWQKGFTNLAQVFPVARKMLQDGRPKAQSAILVLTDPNPSFTFQTTAMVDEIKAENVELFFAAVSDFEGDRALKKFQRWASHPWETHFYRLPGVAAMEADPEIFSKRFVEKFCPKTVSQATLEENEKMNGYILVRDGGQCGGQREKVSDEAMTPADCYRLARHAEASAFSLGKGALRRGHCYVEKMEVARATYEGWAKDRRDPPCEEKGGWTETEFFDTYAITPNGVKRQAYLDKK